MSTSEAPQSREVGFLTRWRRGSKEAPTAAERSTPIFRALNEGIRQKKGVLLRYRSEQAQEEAGILLDPRELYKRGGHLYIRGKSYPSGKFETIRLDHIIDASLSEPHHQDSDYEVSYSYMEKKSRARPSFPTYWNSGRSVIGGPWGGVLDLLVLVFIIILLLRGIWWLFASLL